MSNYHLLYEAIKFKRNIRFNYKNKDQKKWTFRTVSPHFIIKGKNNKLYVFGICQEVLEYRSYIIEGMRNLTVLDDTFETEEEFYLYKKKRPMIAIWDN